MHIATVYAQQIKPQVSVEFLIQDSNYRSRFDQNEPGLSTVDYESDASDSIAALLNRHFPFIEFTRNPTPNKLTFTLSRGVVAIKILPVLDTETQQYVTDQFEFRGISQLGELAPAALSAFVGELRNKCNNWITQRNVNIVNDLLSKIKVCDNASADKSGNQWVMPFSMQDLQIGLRSKINIETILESNICDYKTSVVGPNNNPKGKLNCRIDVGVHNLCIEKMESVGILGIYVTDYIPASIAIRPSLNQ